MQVRLLVVLICFRNSQGLQHPQNSNMHNIFTWAFLLYLTYEAVAFWVRMVYSVKTRWENDDDCSE